MFDLGTCRFCGAMTTHDSLVKYGVRHYAHFGCYLEAGKSLHDLQPWQIGRFPWTILKRHGLYDEALRLMKVAATDNG